MGKQHIETDRDIARLLVLLTAIRGRILQAPDRRTGVVLRAGTRSLASAAVGSSVMGAVGTFGVAGTGAMIAGLGGAAKTTASLYWLGGLVGGGVAAGGVVLAATAVGGGIYASSRVHHAILGGRRGADDLSPVEVRIISALDPLIRAAESVKPGHATSRHDLTLFFTIGIAPVLAAIDRALDTDGLDGLKPYHRIRLRRHVGGLRSLQRAWDRP
ncbi:hypothetical protein [uncultured Paracoccus sp.]|uniref:hypothetical protein n=1 Tax=uncultured Paracoccus sp. TaxID=189685 RepID=UPI0025D35276|nr:hypothetical protein [uncultured Paracoccus sp.]